MEEIDRRIGARSAARLLGDWRPPDGRGLTDALADRVRLLILDGQAPAADPHARRARAGGRARGEPHDGRRGLRSAARRGHAAQQARRGQLDPARPAHAGRARHAVLPAAVRRRASTSRTPRSPPRSRRCARPPPRPPSTWTPCSAGTATTCSGRPELRAAIADRFTARGLPTRPDQVLVTSGAQHAFALILATLTGAGDRVLVEHPTYPNALDAVRARGARPVPVPMGPGRDGTGSWDLDLLTASVRDAAPRLMYVIPDFHNPTGGVLDAAGRERLVALARRTGTPVRDRRDDDRAGPRRPAAAARRRRSAAPTRRTC